MATKYKFILTLPDNFEVDSAEEIEGKVSWPNWSQADPVSYKGVFNTREEAEAAAAAFKIYKYVLHYHGYDSYDDEEFPRYYTSIFDAEDAACRALEIEAEYPQWVKADNYEVVEAEDGAGFTYRLHYVGTFVYDSEEQDERFATYEEAEKAAEEAMEEFEVEDVYSLEPVEILEHRVEAMEIPDEVKAEEFEIQGHVLVKYNGTASRVTIPDSVTEIGDEVFKDCATLTAITIPNSVTELGRYLFRNCTALAEVTLPATLGGITEGLFYGCKSLCSVTIPRGVVWIHACAFAGCASLTELHIPEGVTYLGDSVLSKCGSLTKVTLPTTLEKIGAHAFSCCTALKELVLPEALTSIGEGAFTKCGLESLEIPKNVRYFYPPAFFGCANLARLTVHSENETFYSEGNCIIDKLQGWLMFGCKNSVIPTDGSITEIYKNAFRGCLGLTRLHIPEGVKRFGESAFAYCSDLEEVTLPNSIRYIRENVFEHCSSLKQVHLPDSISGTIAYGAFSNCTSLTEVKIPEGVTGLGICAFATCTELTAITLPATLKTIDSTAFLRCEKLTITAPKGSCGAEFALKNDIPLNEE